MSIYMVDYLICIQVIKESPIYFCDTMGGNRFSVYGCQSENPFVCFGVKPTQRAYARDRKWTREGRSERRRESAEEDSRIEIAVQRRTQSAEGGSEKMETEQRRESTEVRKTTAQTCWPTEAGLTNARKWVSIPSGFVEVSCKYTPAIACKCTERCTKVSQTSPLLRLNLNQARVCSFVLFFHPLGCVLCVRKEMCNAPGRR